MAKLNITLAQLNPIVGALDYNRKKIMESWRSVPKDTDLIIFSELVVCGYPPEDLILKASFICQVKNTVEAILKESKNLNSAALLPCPWEIDGKIYNAVHLIENGEIKATTLKHHLPNYGVFDECRVFAPGPMPAPLEFKGQKLGVMICEDMWYKDVAAHLKSQGADILIVVNGSPFDADKNEERLKCARLRISETGLPLIYVNQVGGQDELVFDGASFALSPDAQLLTKTPEFQEVLHYAKLKEGYTNIDTSQSTQSAPELDKTEQIYKALTLGLRDYVQKNNFPGVVIGLSGGIDSALTAVIAVDALGVDKVHPVMMPSRYTSQDSLDDAEELAKNIGIHLGHLPIEEPVEALNSLVLNYVETNTGEEVPPVTLENVQSRTRGLILMALSNASGNMVLSTGNKSEMAVGYATLYGDMCGGFNALKDVYKTQVYELSNWINRDKEIIPGRIITKAPTAELRDNQTDQDTLPPYEDLDIILHNAIEMEKSAQEIAALGFEKETVNKILTMIERTEYKRRQSPPGVKITSRSFGRDRRYPMTNHFIKTIKDSA